MIFKEKTTYTIIILLLIVILISLLIFTTTIVKNSNNSCNQTIESYNSLGNNSIISNFIYIEKNTQERFVNSVYALSSLIFIIDILSLFLVGFYHNSKLKNRGEDDE